MNEQVLRVENNTNFTCYVSVKLKCVRIVLDPNNFYIKIGLNHKASNVIQFAVLSEQIKGKTRDLVAYPV